MTLEIITKNVNPVRFVAAMASVANTYPSISSLYSTHNIRYREALSKYLYSSSKDLSFAVYSGSEALLVFQGFYSIQGQHHIMNCGDIPCAVFERKNIPKNIQRQLLLLFTAFLRDCDCNVEIVNGCDGVLSYICESLYQQVPDSLGFLANRDIRLDQPLEAIKSNVRKSYKSLINKGNRLLKISTTYGTQANPHDFEEFRLLHKSAANRETRTTDTWDAQFESILKEESFCVMARLPDTGRLVSAALFSMAYNHVYYAVSASDRDLFRIPLSHPVIATAIDFSKSMGSLLLRIDSYSVSHQTPRSTKLSNISLFKSGFGGSLLFEPILRFHTRSLMA